jgi:hypothetical protein
MGEDTLIPYIPHTGPRCVCSNICNRYKRGNPTCETSMATEFSAGGKSLRCYEEAIPKVYLLRRFLHALFVPVNSEATL